MITYKDRTYCSSWGHCANSDCDRWISIEEIDSATLPIALADLKTDDCGYIPKPSYDALVRIVGAKHNER
jgi:hypothetical protein